MKTIIEDFLKNRERRGCSTNAIKSYTSHLNLLARWLKQKGVNWEDVRTSHLEDYLADLRESNQTHRTGKRSPTTIRQRATAIRTLFRWAHETRIVDHDPSKDLHIPKRPQRLPKTIAPDQIRKLINSTLSSRDRAIIYLILDSGMRRAEVADLDIEDLDLTRNMAHIRHGKGDKERYVLFADQTCEALRTWLKERESLEDQKAVFTNRYGKRLKPGRIYKVIVKAAKAAGVSASPHRLRHTFATNYIDRDGNLADLQLLMGHEHITTTMIYVSVALERLRQKHKQLSFLDELLKT